MNAPSPPAGFRIGHWSDPEGQTGCTVVIPPAGARGGVAVLGGGPGTRETDTLRPLANADRATAVLLTGGSAFGLAAADGVVRWCEEHGRGYETPGGLVPIVPGAVVYDLMAGDPDARPGAEQGYAACEAAAEGVPDRGRVGAGTGASVGKLLGRQHAVAGGLGFAALRTGAGDVVAAVAVVNAVGDVIGEDGEVIAGARRESGVERGAAALIGLEEIPLPGVPEGNSTLVCICTDAPLSKLQCSIVARMAGAGIARAIDPTFTAVDGDVAFCLASGDGGGRAFVDVQVGTAAAAAAAAAIRDAVA